MRKYFGAAAVAVFLLAIALALWGGGRDWRDSPVASIPSILIDFNEEQNQTEILVHGMNDFKYTNITMKITNGTNESDIFERTRDHTYYMSCSTTAEMFTLNITVWNKNKGYAFNATVQKASAEEAPTLLTLNEDRNGKIYPVALDTTKLPWKRLMERMK
jgi:hypothetical protein